jgi:hypothetical protein
MNTPQNTQPNPKTNNNNHRPENKDNLDSRKNEEYDFKGNDITHNKKENHSEGKKHEKK